MANLRDEPRDVQAMATAPGGHVEPVRSAVSPASDDDLMTITMTNYGLAWTDAAGVPHASVVSYDKTSAEQRKAELETAGCTDVRIVETKPGEVLAPRG